MTASLTTAATVLVPALLDLAGVARGREATPKDPCLSSGLDPLDRLLEGGRARGRLA
jgi:hypothetical protein